MNSDNEVYWEKKKLPEYPMFLELKDSKPNWDTAKRVFDVDDKYKKYYGGILGNKVADKEQKQNTRAKERSATTSNGKGDQDEQEEEYFNSLRTKIKIGNGSDSDTPASPRTDSCACDKEKGIICQVCTAKKRDNSTSNSPRNRSNPEILKKKSLSGSNSPRNAGTGKAGFVPSKFKNT